MLTKGDVLNDRYVIEEQVGSGGYGTVFRARDRKEDRFVAVKVLRADLADDPDYRRRFRREADIARSLKSEHVVRVLESGEAEVRGETIDFQVMEFMDGETLHERIKRGRIPVRKALYIAAQIAEALDEAEERGIAHRDVKPKNIFIGKGELARLGDFGVARATEYPSLQPDDPILGTPRYMSPEQCLGTAKETDIRSDIYSLGIVLYEMIAGVPPFEGDSPNVITFKHVNERPKPLKALAKAIPDEVEGVVSRCLEKLPEDRYQHASELQSALWSLIDGLTSVEDTPITPVGLKPRRLPVRYRIKRLTRLWGSRVVRRAAAALLLVGLAAAIGGGIWLANRGSGSTPSSAAANVTPTEMSSTVGADSRSPESSRIAYLRLAENATVDLVVAKADGNDARAIETGINFPQSPIAWSPLGDELAYCLPGGLHIVGLDASNPRTIPFVSANCSNPVWSPDGETIAFAEWTSRSGPRSLWEVQRDGSVLVELSVSSDNPDDSAIPIGWVSGNSLVFAGTYSGQPGLYAFPGTKDLWPAAKPDQLLAGSVLGAALSADGKTMLAQVDQGIETLDPDTREVKTIIQGGRHPVLSPDGSRIAFTRQTGTGSDAWRAELYIADVDGSNEKQITPSAGAVTDYSWSPNSKGLIYDFAAEASSLDKTQVMSANIEGSMNSVLSGEGTFGPAWSPQLPVPYAPLRPLLKSGAQFEQALFLNMDGSSSGQIVIRSQADGQCTRTGGQPSAPIQYLDIYTYQNSPGGWTRLMDGSAFPSTTSPLVTPDPCLDVDSQAFALNMKADQSQQLIVVEHTSTGVSVGSTVVSVLGLTGTGGPTLLYTPQSWSGWISVSPDGSNVDLEPLYYGPVDSFCCPSGHSKVRLSWDDKDLRVIPELISTDLNCDNAYVQAVNLQSSYLEAVCDPGELRSGRYSISASYDPTTVFSGLSSPADLHVGQEVKLELALLLPLESTRIPLAKVSLLQQPSPDSSTVPPPAPLSLSSGDCCDLVWDPSPGTTEYWIEAKGDCCQDWTVVYVLSGEGQFFVGDSTVPVERCCEWSFFPGGKLEFQPTGTYSYRVRAWNPAGESPPSEEVSKAFGTAQLSPTPAQTNTTTNGQPVTTVVTTPTPTEPASATDPPSLNEACVQDVVKTNNLVVPGTSNIFGACRGLTPSADGDTGGTTAPGVAMPSGNHWLSFPSITGTIAFSPGWFSSADGSFGLGNGADLDSYYGISGIKCSDQMFLVGVFTTELAPGSPVPPTLDFTGDTDFQTFSPEVDQLFFIGDGRNSSGDLQQFAIPTGATRLYLGFADGGSAGAFHGLPQAYHDNLGQLTVELQFSN